MAGPKDPPIAEFELLKTDLSAAEKAAGICALFTDDCVLEDTTSSHVVRGAAEFEVFCGELMETFPDFRVEPEEIFEVGTTSIMVLNISGTHSSDFMGYAASGKHVSWRAVAIYRCNEDCTKVRHETWAYDAKGIIDQITGETND